MLESILATVLIIGILPSFAGLSAWFESQTTSILEYTGPLNILKITGPLFFFYLLRNRKILTPSGTRILVLALLVGSVSTFYSAKVCGFPAATIREWALTILGVVSGLCFAIFRPKNQVRVIVGWCSLVFSLGAMDVIFPSGIDWLEKNIFDSSQRIIDMAEVGVRPLAGVFSRQSMAKFLSWLPWLLAFILLRRSPSRRNLIVCSAIVFMSTIFILWTSQRGPFVGSIVGIVLVGFRFFLVYRQRKILGWTALAILTVSIGTSLVVPKDIWLPRIQGVFYRTPSNEEINKRLVEGQWDSRDPMKVAAATQSSRWRMFLLSMQIVSISPFGNACIPNYFFKSYNVFPAHSHNLFVQPFRERGWIWGLCHLALWLVVVLGVWNSCKKTEESIPNFFLFGGLASVIVGGQFDYPWQSLSQSIALGAYLGLGLLIGNLPIFSGNQNKHNAI